MTGLLDLCEDQFETRDLYAVLHLEKTATSNELRKGYHKVSLKVHPDRCSGDDKEDATKRFQTLGRVYQLLADNDLRSIYDKTGAVDEESCSNDSRDWVKYWRTLFRQVTEQDIVDFENKYVGSKEELSDLEAAYNEGEGSMDHILRTVLLCTVDDEERFRAIIADWIEQGTVEEFVAYSRDTDKKKKQRKRKAAKEAKEAEVAKKELGLGDGADDLQALILARGKSRAVEMDSFLDNLADKYSKPTKKTNKKSKK